MKTKNLDLPTREELERMPSMRIPKSLLKRILKFCKYRGDWTAFVIEALTREASRRESKEK
jgi:hypothetical protein